jgi:hypothetical protein
MKLKLLFIPALLVLGFLYVRLVPRGAFIHNPPPVQAAAPAPAPIGCQVTIVGHEEEFAKHDDNKVLILTDAQEVQNSTASAFYLYPMIHVFNGCQRTISGAIDFQIVRGQLQEKSREQLFSGNFFIHPLPPNTSTVEVSHHAYGGNPPSWGFETYEILATHLEQN